MVDIIKDIQELAKRIPGVGGIFGKEKEPKDTTLPKDTAAMLGLGDNLKDRRKMQMDKMLGE